MLCSGRRVKGKHILILIVFNFFLKKKKTLDAPNLRTECPYKHHAVKAFRTPFIVCMYATSLPVLL